MVRKKYKEVKTNLREKVLKYLVKDKSIQTKKIHFNDNEVRINCMNMESAKAAEKLLTTKLASSCKVEKDQLQNPKIKIIGIDNFSNMDNSVLENYINTRNFSNLDTKGKIIHSAYNNYNKNTTVMMEVTAEIHKVIKENRDRLFVGYQNCRVLDIINAKPCFNCTRFGHNGIKCTNKPICLKCAGSHLTRNCEGTKPLCCPNCKFSNDNFGKKYSTNHTATDSEMCEILKSKIRLHTSSTDYNIKPYIPRYLGKVDLTGKYQRTSIVTSNLRSTVIGGSTDSILSETLSRIGSPSVISTS